MALPAGAMRGVRKRFLFSQTQICKDLAWDGLREPVKEGRSVFCTGIRFLQTGTRASKRLNTGKNRRAFDDGSGPAAQASAWPTIDAQDSIGLLRIMIAISYQVAFVINPVLSDPSSRRWSNKIHQ